MSILKKLNIGRRKEEKAEMEAPDCVDNRNKTIKAMRKYAEKTCEAFDAIKELEELMTMPQVVYDPAKHSKATIPGTMTGLDMNLVIVYGVSDNPEPLCAYLEEAKPLNIGAAKK